MSAEPHLLLIMWNTEPKDVTAFMRFVLGDLGISVGPDTIVAHHQDPLAHEFDEIWPGVVVLAIRYLETLSLSFDSDRTIYQDFQASSPLEEGWIRGHVFQIFGRPAGAEGRAGSERDSRDRLVIGMSYAEVVALLGEPSGSSRGSEMIEGGSDLTVVASDKARERLANTQYCVWKHPDGTYALVFENGKLIHIHDRP